MAGRKRWRKVKAHLLRLHLALDADSGEIIAHSLTDQDIGDTCQVEPLLNQINDAIDQFTADCAYDGAPTYHAVLRHSVAARVVIPPRSTAVASQDTAPAGQRDLHIASINRNGRLKWQNGGNIKIVRVIKDRNLIFV